MREKLGSGPLSRSWSIFDLPPGFLPSHLPSACYSPSCSPGPSQSRQQRTPCSRAGWGRDGGEAGRRRGEADGRLFSHQQDEGCPKSLPLDPQHQAETCVPLSSCSSRPIVRWLVCFCHCRVLEWFLLDQVLSSGESGSANTNRSVA